jgi:hypothetical protein
MSILPKGFAPSWDCKLASCNHAYHSWCALNHISTSSKCLHWEEEMHVDWWTMSRIKKLSSKEEKAKETNLGHLYTTLEGT